MVEPLSVDELAQVRERVERSLLEQHMEHGDYQEFWDAATVPDVTVNRLLEEIDRLREVYRHDMAELERFRDQAVEAIGQDRLTYLLAEIKRLRQLVDKRDPSGVMTFVGRGYSEEHYEPSGEGLVCRECSCPLGWSPWTSGWIGRHERGCETSLLT